MIGPVATTAMASFRELDGISCSGMLAELAIWDIACVFCIRAYSMYCSGYFVSVLFIPYSLKAALAALVLFRIFDILKPFPINKIQKLKGGLGIFMDDILAGVMANVIVRVLIIAGIL